MVRQVQQNRDSIFMANDRPSIVKPFDAPAYPNQGWSNNVKCKTRPIDGEDGDRSFLPMKGNLPLVAQTQDAPSGPAFCLNLGHDGGEKSLAIS